MFERIKAWQLRRAQATSWRHYDRAVLREGYLESQGLGHPEWVQAPPFPRPARWYER